MILKLALLCRSSLHQPGVRAREAVIRNLSLSPNSIIESATKAIAVQQKSLDCLVKAFSCTRTALHCLLADQVATPHTASGLTHLEKITEQDTWFIKVTLSTGSFFNLPDFDWFGSWRPWLQSTLLTSGITLLTIIIVVSLRLCILSEALNACL